MDIGFFLGLALIVGIIAVPKLIEGSRETKLKNQIHWTTTKNNSWDSPRALALWQYIHNYQIHSVEKDYRICNNEWEFARSIIQTFSDDIGRKYLDRKIESTSFLASLSSEDFFFTLLYDYLWRYNSHTICGKPIYGNYYDTKNKYDSTVRHYNLTDEGIVFYKLCYITCLYCKFNPRINNIKTGMWIHNDAEKYYQTVIDNMIYEELLS